MATKTSRSTLGALNAKIAALQEEAGSLRKQEIAEVIARIGDAVVHYGLTAADLGFATGARKNKTVPKALSGKSTSKRLTKPAPTRPARAVKFKDDRGNTWGGMGKRPAWFKTALASGKTPEELLA